MKLMRIWRPRTGDRLRWSPTVLGNYKEVRFGQVVDG